MHDTDKSLTPKQARFVQEYLVDLNGTAAAVRAGYSKKTANVQAAQLLTKLNIQEAVQVGIDKRAEETGINTEYVVKNLKMIAEKAMEKGELSNACRALDLLGRHTGAFEKDNKQRRQVIRITSNI